jgi:FolB domain-containing protein
MHGTNAWDVAKANDMDKVQIKDLRAHCKIGVRYRERRRRQTVIVNVSCYCDLPGKVVEDRIERTVDYSELSKKIRSFVETSNFYLIETLAEGIAKICLEHDLVQRATVNVAKPHVIARSGSVCVEVTRTKDSVKSD